MTTRLAMVADTMASVRWESRVWVEKLIGEGHATVRRNRRAVEEELMVELLRRPIECRDATGNAATAAAVVTVPHDRSR